MKRALVPSLLLGTMILSACGGIEGKNPAPAGPSDSAKPPVVQPVTDTPKTDPKTEPNPAPPPPEKPKVEESKPAIKWYSPGIGLPLKSDDPAAQGMKVAMLTFDDGPHPENTDKVLATLKQETVKALWFITGYGAKHRDVLERIHKDGHVIGVHSMTHANLTKLSGDELRQEIAPLVKLIEEVTGAKPKYFRPPFGAYDEEVRNLAKEYNMELINWSNGSLDWVGTDSNGYKDPNKVVADVLEQLHPGSNILMHDTLKHTAEALPELIKQLRAKGYDFVVLQ